MTPAAFFAGREAAFALFLLVEELVRGLGACTMRTSRAQIAFARRRGFAWVWTPDRWLRGDVAPLVLTIALSRRDRSVRWKSVVEPVAGRFVHHLEVRSAADLDERVRACLHVAWTEAG